MVVSLVDEWNVTYTESWADTFNTWIHYQRCVAGAWNPPVLLFEGLVAYIPDAVLKYNNDVYVSDVDTPSSYWWTSSDGGVSFSPIDTRDGVTSNWGKTEFYRWGGHMATTLGPISTVNAHAKFATTDDEGENWSAVSTLITTNGTVNDADGCCDENMDEFYVVAGTVGGALQFRKSTDYGASWSVAVNIVAGLTRCRAINVVARSGHIFVVWCDVSNVTRVSYSHDDGATWNTLAGSFTGQPHRWLNYTCVSDSGVSFIILDTVGMHDILYRYTATNWDAGAPSFSLDGTFEVPPGYSDDDTIYVYAATMPRHGVAHNKKSILVSYEIYVGGGPAAYFTVFAIDDVGSYTLLDGNDVVAFEIDAGSVFAEETTPPPGLSSPRGGTRGSHDSSDDGSFSLIVYKPSFTADGSNVIYTPKGTLIDEISYKIDSYQHEIRRYGGYWSASIDMRMPPQDAETWFLNGLGWHIVVIDSYLMPIWEGFINEITYNVGGLQATRGPLTDICNRCSVTYSILDTGSSPPDVGTQTTTTAADHDGSKLKYGIFDKILTTGSMDNSAGVLEADQLRDAYLAENHEPETSQRVTLFGQQSGHNIHVECLGYYEFLKYPYNNLAAGVDTVSAKIADILDADPNSLFSSANADIEDNAVITHAWEDENNVSWDLLLELAKMGGPAYEPYNIGVYGGRHVVYEAIPTAVEYYQVLRDNRMIIETSTGDEVKPWHVRPGKWKMLRDFLVGRVPGGVPLREDPRMALIESVVFSFPNSLTITSNKVDTVKQRLGQAGLFGIGV